MTVTAERIVEVARFLAKHPAASASLVHREVGGRRQDVLAAVRALRAAGLVEPSAETAERLGPGSHCVRCPCCGCLLDLSVAV